uniref:Ribosomal protein L14 n=1 Tax=Pteridomonas sp. YPF1301 TaxID=2766739 RepID=A0A7G1MQN1_9STRA|nr:ribosomal protein L14 [Pteridomonas sp. YPF1301]
MINIQTRLTVIDNTGVKKILCIRILGSTKSIGIIGDLIIGTIKEAIPQSKLKKSEIIRGLIVCSKQLFRRFNGTHICFEDNAVVLVTKDNTPIGTRIFGSIAQ